MEKTFSTIIGQFRLAGVNRMLNSCKSKGVQGNQIFKAMFVLCFLEIKNISQLISSGYGTEIISKKDVFFSFLKNPNIDWRKIFYSFVCQFIRILNAKGDEANKNSPKCLIIDDSLLEKSGKTIELIGKLFDHCSYNYLLGLRRLTLGYWDSKSFIPVDFTIHNEPGKNKNKGLKVTELKAQFTKQRNIDSHGYQRIQQVNTNKIQAAVSMIKTAIKKGLTPMHVLADSWFILQEFIADIQKIKTKHTKKLHVIGIMKTNRNVTIDKATKKASGVPELKRREVKYNKEFKCFLYASVIIYQGIEMKAFWVKMKGQSDWKMLIKTDISLTFK